jgi:heptosyltransferase-1/heptosyltransferase-2
VHQEFMWLPRRPVVATQVREKWRTDSARWVALLPGARWDNKRWPVENFLDLTRRLLSVSPDLNVAILGSKDDQALGGAIASVDTRRCLDLTGKTALPEMVEWLRLCELVITNDTGPMHVAAALRRPIIALFGPTDPSATGPYGQSRNVLQVSNLPCVPCLKGHCSYKEPLACLHGISSAAVFQKAQTMLKENAQNIVPA